MTSVKQALDAAWHHYGRREWQQAEQLYRQVLQVDPEQVDALHLLAAITGQTGREDEAINCLRIVLRIRPDFAAAHNNLGILLAAKKHFAEAVTCFQEAVRLQPEFVPAHNNLGNALREDGRLAEAEACLRQALRCRPDNPETHHNLGLVLKEQGRPDEALATLRQAVLLRPGYPEAHFALGNVLMEQKQPAEAAASYRQAVHFQPDHAESQLSLGLALLQMGQPAAAVADLQQAVRLKPDWADAHFYLGNALQGQGKLDEAAASYRQAMRLKPDFVEVHNNLGNALRELGQLAEAEARLQHALRLRPDYVEAHNNLGLTLRTQGKLDEAVAIYQHAMQIKPDFAEAHYNMGNTFKYQGRLDDAIAAYRVALQLMPDAAPLHSALVMDLHYHPGYDAGAILEESRRWNQQHAEPLKKFIRPHTNHRDPERRVRIGYISPDFREHSCSFFTIPLLSHHDHQQFEIVCYADVARPDSFTEVLRSHADLWRSTVGLSDQQVAEMIHGDQIDILVDLAMHTAKNRLLVFARKPAPIQASWLAYPGTTGLSAMDYRLTDPYLDPPGLFDAYYSEESIRLPETFWCYDPQSDQPPVNPLPAFENGFVTFGCLNNFCKVNDDCLALWAQVLRAVPQSHLLLVAPSGQSRERVLARFQQEGIVAPRVEFADRQPRQAYLELYHRIDLCLDPLPCNGGTTTLDALWMGVPTLTRLGKTVVGRAGWSLLCNLGLSELAAETDEQYVALAARLARDMPRLQELRGSLRQWMQRSPLLDAKRFARHMEEAYRHMWRRWCQATAVNTKLPTDWAPATLAEPTNAREPSRVVLHVGCGPKNAAALHPRFHSPEWREVRLDIDRSVAPDIVGSITDMSAVGSATVEAIWSSHNLEHLYAHEVPVALGEFFRVLKPGGLVFITLPDLQQVAAQVAQGRLEEVLFVSPTGPVSPIDVLYGFRRFIANGNHFQAHKTGFTAQSLRRKLHDAGFCNIQVQADSTYNLWATADKPLH